MEEPIQIAWINDFIFCPASIYFHNLYGSRDALAFKEQAQINGTHAHKTIDEAKYSTRAAVVSGQSVYCEKYGLLGKIDVFDEKHGVLTERKKKISVIYDGYVFQMYAQCFALREMGYTVNSLNLYSLDDNKRYPLKLPENDKDMLVKFEAAITGLRTFDLSNYKQTNESKCRACIYEPLCDRSLLD